MEETTISENNKFKENLEEIIELIFQYNPALGAYLGREEFEKKVAIGTPENYLEFVKKLSESLDQVKKISIEELSQENRNLFQILNDSHDIFQFLHDAFPLWNKNPLGLDDIQQTIFALLQRKGPTEKMAEVVIAQLEQLPQFLEEFRLRFDGSPIPKVWKETSLDMVQSAPQFLGFLEMIFKELISINIENNFLNAIKTAKTAISSHTTWIQDLPVDDNEFAWSLRKENFEKLLTLRKLPWGREKILKTGYELLDSLTEKAQQLAKDIDPTKTFNEVVDEINAHHPLTFEMVLEHARSEAERAKKFIKKHDLASIPETESLVITETPAYLAPLIPIAMYGPPPFYDPNQPGIYYITRPLGENGIKKLGFHSYYSLPNVMAHEAYPGHHLDLCWTNYSCSAFSMISFFMSTLGSETVEGWAHYCEEMMLEQGFHNEIGQNKVKLVILLGQIWRAVRIIVDVELHCKQRTIDDAIKLLVERAKLDEQSAKAEVRRYTMAPGYQLSYLIGKLLIQNLRQKVEEKQGENFKLKEFHDTILKSGDLPYYLLKELFEAQS
ncbi:MAG: DUF885 domain-containing protein [Candidatus Hodarchaeales archaeon]|jgi:hypothetical protein